MNIAQVVQQRRTCKAFDPNRQISQETMDALRAVLRFAPSSVNSQPWHYIIASTQEGKALVAKGMQGPFVYNEPKVMNASHVVVLCARQSLDDNHLSALLQQEEKDGRFATPEAKAGQDKSRRGYADLHENQLKDAHVWMDKQVYIALGTLLMAAATLDVDACAMEGFDAKAVDAALGLPEKGLRAVVAVALGYRSDADFNAALPKSRLPALNVISEI